MIDRVGLSYGGWGICAVRLSLTIYPLEFPRKEQRGLMKNADTVAGSVRPCSSEGGL